MAERDPRTFLRATCVDFVVESTGIWQLDIKWHITQSEEVIITAPARTRHHHCMGVNEDKYDPANHHVISNSAPQLLAFAKVLDTFGIKKGLMTTVLLRNDQRILDLPPRSPPGTGCNDEHHSYHHRCCRAIGLVLPELKGKLDGTL